MNPMQVAIANAVALNVLISINVALLFAWTLPNLKYPVPAKPASRPDNP